MKTNCLFALMAAVLSSATLAFGTTPAYTNVIAGDHPVSFWPLNETSGTLIHDVVGTNNGTVMNAGSMALGSPGILYSNGVTSDTCINFLSGGSPYIYVPWATNLNSPLMAITIEGWFKLPTSFPGSTPEGICMWSCNSSCAQGWAQFINYSSPYQVSSWLGGPGNNDWRTPVYQPQSTPGQWVYLVTAYDGTSSRLYTNGVLATNSVFVYKPETEQDRGELLMGAYEQNCPPTGLAACFYQGGMENLAFYNYALSAVQVANHYFYGTNLSGGAITNPPSIATPPLSQTNFVTQTASFTVAAGGTAPFYYQWRGGATGSGVYTNLMVNGQIASVTNATLSISGLGVGNAGDYVVVVTNSVGSITSAVARLTVLTGAPFISSPPLSQTNYVGQTATFTVGAGGLAPLSYQWTARTTGSGVFTNLNAGGQYSTVTNASLSISNLTLANGADFEVVVSNISGSVTSSVATLTVALPTYDVTVLNDLPVSYWPLQETNGPTIHDVAGANNGTLMTSTDGTALGTNQHNAFATAGSGSSDGATYLLGGPGLLPGDKAVYLTNRDTSVNNSQIVVPYSTTIDPGSSFTAEAWINVPAYPIGYTRTTFQTPLGFEAFGGAENGWWMGIDTDSSASQGDLQFNAAQYPGLWLAPPPTSAVSFAGKWVHAVEVYTGSNSNLLCYTNGVLMATVPLTSAYESETIYSTHKLPFVIGSYSSPGGASGGYNGGGTLATGFERGNFWHGGVSHVAIYNYALTAGQIANHYYVGTLGTIVPTPALSITPSGANVIVTWTNGVLQQAGSVAGPWTDVSNTAPPYAIGATNQKQFFRARSQP